MDIKDIQHLAEVARLDISDAEAEALLSDLKNTISYIDQIENAPLSPDAKNTSFENYNNTREDVVTNESGSFSKDILSQAVDTSSDGYIKVKKVL